METLDTRYWQATYLNFSRLSRAIEYDAFGTRYYNPLAKFAPPMEQTDAMQIGTIVDAHFTEWVNFYDTYQAVSRRSGDDETQLTNTMYNAIDLVIKTINSLPFRPYLETLNAQETLEDPTLQLKGKLDFFDPNTNHIIDLKVPWSIDNFLKDLYTWKDRQLNIYHKYIRQMALYSHLVEVATGIYPTCELLAVSHKGEAILVPITEEARRSAWAVLLDDIELYRTDNSYTYQVTARTTADDIVEPDNLTNWLDALLI